jgi:ABC-type nitrate/sulfonate/bicarbonate transport system substrate-binding protein
MNRRTLFMLSALVASAQVAFAEPVTLRYGQNAAGAGGLSSLPLNVALRKHYFQREGLDLNLVPIAGGTDRIVAALDKGEIDAGKNATPYLISAVLKGSDSVAFMSQTANPVYSLITRRDIETFADLKGKIIGLSTPGDTISLSTVRLLAARGVPASDYRAKVVVGTPARFACLRSGECAAVPMGQPEDIDAVEDGYRRLAFTHEAGADLIFNVDIVRRAWAERNHETVIRFVRAMAASYACMQDPKNKNEMVSIIRETGNMPRHVAREIFEPYLERQRNVLPRQGEIDLAAFNRVLALMAEVGVIRNPVPDATKFVDLRYLEAAGIR